MLTIYGIANCDTMKKARRWLDDQGIAHHFHDYRKAGVDQDWLAARIAEFGWENVVNRKGTTWRKLPEDVRSAMDADSALTALLAQPSMIKRPLLGPLKIEDSEYLLGFSPETWLPILKD